MASFSAYRDETTEFADLVFPEVHYLERFVPFPNSHTVGYCLAARSWSWPCPALEETSSQFDLVAVNYRLPFHTFSFTVQNPWLNELAEHHPCAYKVLMNSRTAKEKGLRDGQAVWVESKVARLQRELKVTESVHPEVVAIAGAFGHWAQGMPVARGKGLPFNSLLPGGLEQLDTLSAGLDMCVKVKLYNL